LNIQVIKGDKNGFRFIRSTPTKAQKRAAKSAQALREQAVRDMLIELHLLINEQERARQVLFKLYEAEQRDPIKLLADAIDAAQETIDRVGRFNEMFPSELADLQRAANNAAGFEALATFELWGRDTMVKVRDEAKNQLTPMSVMVMEARRLLEA
jgi:hypothetical protein